MNVKYFSLSMLEMNRSCRHQMALEILICIQCIVCVLFLCDAWVKFGLLEVRKCIFQRIEIFNAVLTSLDSCFCDNFNILE